MNTIKEKPSKNASFSNFHSIAEDEKKFKGKKKEGASSADEAIPLSKQYSSCRLHAVLVLVGQDFRQGLARAWKVRIFFEKQDQVIERGGSVDRKTEVSLETLGG